ncbi:YHS domain-containing protein [Candidatus Cryosericum terrychapinii]|uniref:YHS domain-containing protein n=1 Tax=Candidatus Cryosericum terrychapinii TaxID=2290919 RepID=A0A398D2B4_9BACT|nr:YHS domain-containing protein [Candidatus Cryosericum terrychapinii]RIE06317.1 YHS domain-containing protein [Candidatus Cryosericum terrychapinii]
MDKPLCVNEVDPVCGMALTLVEDVETSTLEGKTYGFCSKGCKETFEGNPKKYIEKPAAPIEVPEKPAVPSEMPPLIKPPQ